MILKVPEELASHVLNTRHHQGSYGMVNSIFKLGHCPTPVTILRESDKWNCRMDTAREKLVEFMIANSSAIVSLTDNGMGMFGVLFSKKGKIGVRIEYLMQDIVKCVNPKECYTPISSKSLDDIIPSVINESHRRAFKRSIRKSAFTIIKDNMGDITIPTLHVLERWAERVYGVSQGESEAYSIVHGDALRKEVLAKFDSSEFIWSKEGWGDFYYNRDLDLFFVKDGIVLVTVYTKEFNSLPSEINKVVTRMMITRIKNGQKKLDSFSVKCEAQVDSLENKIIAIKEHLNAERIKLEELIIKRDNICTAQRAMEDSLLIDVTKLLKPCDVIN